MKTLILSGSTKKGGDTDVLVGEFKKHLAGEVKTVSYFDNISPCVDCRYCWTNPGCSIKDGMQDIYSYVEDCDNVVIASPIWLSELSGPLLTIASRFQTYFAARYFRGEDIIAKHKNSLLILAGAQAGTEANAIETANTILRKINAKPCMAKIFSLNTNAVPAAVDAEALNAARQAAFMLNKSYKNQFIL